MSDDKDITAEHKTRRSHRMLLAAVLNDCAQDYDPEQQYLPEWHQRFVDFFARYFRDNLPCRDGDTRRVFLHSNGRVYYTGPWNPMFENHEGFPIPCTTPQAQWCADHRDAVCGVRQSPEDFEKWRLALNIPERLGRATFVTSQPRAALAAVRDYMAKGYGPGRALVLLGGVGSGKTWASCCALRVASRGRFVEMGGVAPMDFDQRRDKLEECCGTGLRILDDVKHEHLSQAFTKELVENALEYRYQHCLPTIITCNGDTEQLTGHLSPRVVSRLNEWATFIELLDPDMRAKGGA